MKSEDKNDLLAQALEGYPATFGVESSSAPPVPTPWGRRLMAWVGIAVPVLALPVLALPVLSLLMRTVFSTSFPVYELTAVDVQYAPLGAGTVATPGSAVDLSLRPRTAVAEKVSTQSFIACPGEDHLHPWQPPPSTEITGKGFVTVHGRLGDVLEPGPCQIWIVVARPGKFPRDLSSQLLTGRKAGSNWQAVSATFEAQPRKPF